MRDRQVAGCMTGTSLDGLDCALLCVRGVGLHIAATIRRCTHHALAPLDKPLRAMAAGQPFPASRIAALGRELELLHVAALRELARDDHLDLVAVHGQTVFHAPPISWQLCSAARLARELNAPVVFDLRAADLAAGGQGAPITPLADYVFFQDAAETRGVVNLGGFCNYTWLPRGPRGPHADRLAAVRGGDVCACNHLLDRVSREVLGAPYDEGGARAEAGHLNNSAYAALTKRLREQAAANRSLGSGDEATDALRELLRAVPADDLARSACEAIATVVAEKLGSTDRVIVAGGGAHNRAVVGALRRRTGATVSLSNEFGVPVQAREAAAIAVLGALCQDGVPLTLPQITGCATPAPRAGTWVYPPGDGTLLQ